MQTLTSIDCNYRRRKKTNRWNLARYCHLSIFCIRKRYTVKQTLIHAISVIQMTIQLACH